MLKECVDCGKSINVRNRQTRCEDCQKVYRGNYQQSYHKRYKSDKPKSAIKGQTYQYWKFLETLIDEELVTLFQVRRQKLKHEKDRKKFREIKTQMKIIMEIYEKRVGDRVLEKGEGSEE